MKTSARLIIAPDDHAKMSSVRSADRRGRPRLGFLVPRWSPSRGRTFLSAAPPDSRHVEHVRQEGLPRLGHM